MRLFENAGDNEAFLGFVAATREVVPMRVVAYCIMPNHWHLVLWPYEDGHLSQFMHRLTLTHTKRWHSFRGTSGSGHIYQGRFKSFPVQSDEHFLVVCRYVERNALRANMVDRAEHWQWSSLYYRSLPGRKGPLGISDGPIGFPDNWVELVNSPQTQQELEAVRKSVIRGRPYGSEKWAQQTAKNLGLVSTLRPRGRPTKRYLVFLTIKADRV
jgi:putative transposase